jgi:hypothetical protein
MAAGAALPLRMPEAEKWSERDAETVWDDVMGCVNGRLL